MLRCLRLRGAEGRRKQVRGPQSSFLQKLHVLTLSLPPYRDSLRGGGAMGT